MKKLLKNELRYIARKYDKTKWGVYDKARGSWPGTSPETGDVKQKTDQPTAELEANRLNSLIGLPVNEPVKPVKEEVKQPEPEVKPAEVEAYEELTQEQKEAYEDGLMEKVTY